MAKYKHLGAFRDKDDVIHNILMYLDTGKDYYKENATKTLEKQRKLFRIDCRIIKKGHTTKLQIKSKMMDYIINKKGMIVTIPSLLKELYKKLR